jgi:hypothetical protein
LKVEGFLSGLDHLHPEAKSVGTDADDAKRRVAGMFARFDGELPAEGSVIGVGERRRRALWKIRARRVAGAT